MKNRALIGVSCIVLALVLTFGVAPIVNASSDSKVEVLRVKNYISKGTLITEDDIELIRVGKYNLPNNLIVQKSDAIGLYTACDLFEGDYVFKSKLVESLATTDSIFDTLNGSKVTISVSISSGAAGLFGKLKSGDIISVIVYNSKDGLTFIPPELTYVLVVGTNLSNGKDSSGTEGALPSTITLLVNPKQAELLCKYENSGKLHYALVFRGDTEKASEFLLIQDEYFVKGAN